MNKYALICKICMHIFVYILHEICINAQKFIFCAPYKLQIQLGEKTLNEYYLCRGFTQ